MSKYIEVTGFIPNSDAEFSFLLPLYSFGVTLVCESTLNMHPKAKSEILFLNRSGCIPCVNTYDEIKQKIEEAENDN